MTVQSTPATDTSTTVSPLLVERHGNVALLTLNRPDARNALSLDLLMQLEKTLEELADDTDIRAIVLTGSAPIFCAGHDLREMTAARQLEDKGRSEFLAIFEQCSIVMQRIVHQPQPVIAAVEGIATAAGCQLVASCDLAVAGASARFATPGVQIGLFCSTPMVALSRAVGRKHALEMLLTGDFIPAPRAYEMGLINRMVDDGSAVDEALGWATKIASKSGTVLKIGKEAFTRQSELPLDRAYAFTAEVMTENMMHAAAQEGIGAFIEKRAPNWPDHSTKNDDESR